MKSTHSDTVHAQFDPQANSYLTSAIHAQGADLLRASELVTQVENRSKVLDVGCGAGHLSFALSPLATQVFAVDPSGSMLNTVAMAAADRGLGNITTIQASAESLPFDEHYFDIVATRYSAHHWLDLQGALKEMHRVVKPGGILLVIDIEGDEDALVDTHLQAMELLRDLSHVRDRTPSEWTRLLSTAGFLEIEHQSWPSTLQFGDWVARMRTPDDRIAMIRALQRDSPSEVQRALSIQNDGSFTASTGLWWCRAT